VVNVIVASYIDELVGGSDNARVATTWEDTRGGKDIR
jgi:hypothetical protein